MSKNIFFISDNHFGHANIITFIDKNGNVFRNFSSEEEMNEHMVEKWNSVVRPIDKVYHLGDFAIPRRGIKFAERLNGDKVLIKGNHDIYKIHDYIPYFRDIRAYHVIDGMILSHVPVHHSSMRRFGSNIHGHVHEKFVYDDSGNIDNRYFPVTCEHLSYTPIEFGELKRRIIAQGGKVGFATDKGDKEPT